MLIGIMAKRARKKTTTRSKPTTVADLKRDPTNPRQRGEKAKATLAKSLEQFGAARSVVIDADGIVRAGNGTLEAAEAAGIRKVKIVPGKRDELVVVQRSDLAGDDAQAYAIADNRTGELAEWDLDQLETQLEGLADFSAADLGFTDYDLESLFPNPEPVGPDDQGNLDEKNPVECPNCGHEFTP